MPKENQIDPRSNFVPRRLPWLLGGVMLVVYWATLNHWINLRNISQVATVSGWIWWPQVQNPLLFLVTLPFRCLPLATVPQALNLFSALCSAATLAVLARTVAILPHDRTEMERMRERSDFSFLSGWAAWAPPLPNQSKVESSPTKCVRVLPRDAGIDPATRTHSDRSD